MKLNKFTSGRFHQLRAQKRYHATHKCWYDRKLSTGCPRCHNEEKDLQHAIQHCPSSSVTREEFIPDLQSIDDIWNSTTIMNQTSLYLRTTLTGYPPRRSGWFPCSPSAASDILSDVESISSSIFSLPA
jgi:hypothetical protein